MESNTAVKLLKAKALGCLDHSEDSELLEFMETAEDFPWLELGEYQNLVSLLPLYLPLELPGNEVKDVLKNKLLELHNQLFPVQEEEPVLVEEEIPTIEEENIPDEVELDTRDIDNHVDHELNIQDNIAFEEPEESVQETIEDTLTQSKPVYKKEIFEEQKEKTDKKIRENIKKIDDELFKLDQTVKRNFFISLGLIVVLIVVVIFIYLSLSSRIGDQQDKFDRLKNDIGIINPHQQHIPKLLDIT